MSPPLTDAEVKASKCTRCKEGQGYAQWNICADKGRRRVVCADCDIALNQLVMEWAGLPDVKAVMARYRRKVRRHLKAG